jgi:hypothetical protein
MAKQALDAMQLAGEEPAAASPEAKPIEARFATPEAPSESTVLASSN